MITVAPKTSDVIKSMRIAEIKVILGELDQLRIRPLAEGDTDYLATLNAQAVELRAELQTLARPEYR